MSPDQQERNVEVEGDLLPYAAEQHAERGVTLSASGRTLQRQDVLAFKFGGTSLLGSERMLHAAGIVQEASASCSVVVIVSAMKGVTDQLLRIAQRIARAEWQQAYRDARQVVQLHLDTLRDLELAEPVRDRVAHELKLLAADLLHETRSVRHTEDQAAVFDRLSSFGERFSARLFSAALQKLGVSAVPVASSDFVLTCENFQDARPQLEQTRHRGRQVLLPLLDAGVVPVVTGFIGATHDGRITTLGRNSSDFSGAIVAHVVDAEELVIWTDVDGIFTANPAETPEAKLLHEMSYDDAHALALTGAKVLHPEVLPLAAQTQMTVWVRNTFHPQRRGTRIGPASQGGVA
jgi:bifunctional aspartokinase / homoserine dehydrogenase 1